MAIVMKVTMRRQFTAFLNAFKTLQPSAPAGELTFPVRHLVSRYARGNVSLQLGKYVTAQDVDQRRRDLQSYRFQ